MTRVQSLGVLSVLASVSWGCGGGGDPQATLVERPPGTNPPNGQGQDGARVDPPAVKAVPELLPARGYLDVSFPTPYAIGDTTVHGRGRGKQGIAQSFDNYHVIFSGPGGRGCRGRLKFALGYLTEERRTRTRTVEIRPGMWLARPTNSTWCLGRFRGHVEYRQPERFPSIPFERLGSFSFTVGASAGD